MVLTRDQILAAEDNKPVAVPVKDWGGDVYVRSMSAVERDAYEADQAARNKDGGEKAGMHNFRARLVVRVACDEQGNRLFNDDDAAALGEKSSGPVALIFDAAAKLNGLTPKDVEELEKNS